jgi:hypothetical protein
MAEDGELESHGDEPPPGFRPGPAAWLVHPPCEEGGRLERHGVTRASASNGARHACPVHLPKCRTTDSNRDPPRPKRGASTCWASSACTTTSLLGESNPGCLRTEEACLPLPLSRRQCVGMIPGVLGGSRTRNRRLQAALSTSVGVRARRAAARCRPGPSAVRKRSRSRARRHGFRGWTRTSGAGFRAPLGTPAPHPETVRKARFERADREV